MNSRAKFPQESSGTIKSHFTPKHSELNVKGRDMEEKPFPTKPVCPKKKSTPHGPNLEKKSEDAPNSTSLGKDTLLEELQMPKVIQEKQLMVQKKLWKLEDAFRAKIQLDHVGVNVYRGNQTVEKKHYKRRQENVNTDTKTKQRTEVRSNEMLTERHNPKQYKLRQDTITKKTERSDEMSAGETLTMRKEESSATYAKSEQPHSQQKSSCRLAIGDRDMAGKTLHEELILPQDSSSPPQELELESTDKNIQLFPCSICKRNFMQDRLEKHMQICEKVKKAKHPVFDSLLHRTKGSAMEEFLKTHTRSRTPEVLRKKKQQKKQK
ncbi:hypothetical protein NQD34_016446 [Periophthalmus magnuspinnatus]|uniref:zinc finger C2HC domain-containing protein 1C-like n=1 Tax=Periophthalmus magnuspinnatus TaxID=409849 RepID=UPI0022BD3DB5|nr:zinc finger C2HC domain-containing protein 1C-like [Periophthalmus magnuspinnatus]XP_055086889.1 zinc finger C2HC domain-containing protein 1C-like [Periophthalmus magnuspinnatus]KAJ0009031.1 hypothetical protein NQD34_016446 [Periophthalmus magnuspinnatus]